MKVHILLFSLGFIGVCSSYPDDSYMHRTHSKHPLSAQQRVKMQEYENAEFWRRQAQEDLAKRTVLKPIESQAKNVIFYLGDGMSVPTVTAARVFKGQKVDGLPFGEEASLHMDTLPYTGTSKTFCSDAQVADSACSATAYLCGVKANIGTIGVTTAVNRLNCTAQVDPANQVSSVLAWAQAKGKSTGIVTTTRVTHASPAGAYAAIADRDWENDYWVANDGQNPDTCPDIAKQLIMNDPGKNINVILGGGRREFTTRDFPDPEFPLVNGSRLSTNLIEAWKIQHAFSNFSYVWGKDQLLQVDTDNTEFLLGLFDPSHVQYLHKQAENNDPSLEEMVEVAIKILSKNPEGFFLFVEGGRIDHAHHDNMITASLWETIEFDKAIQKGDNMTDDNDTLLLVTSDHAHVMHFAGYPIRGNPILKYSGDLALDGLPYATLGYGNGPGPEWIDDTTGKRHDISQDDPDNPEYVAPSPVPLSSETHGGDDVLIFAKGPYAHLLTGVHQQSYIPHVVGFSACIGDGLHHCTKN